MKLVYWKAERLDDGDCYSIRTKTKKEAVALVKAWGGPEDRSPFGPVTKVELFYDNGFELMAALLGEGQGYELMDVGSEGGP